MKRSRNGRERNFLKRLNVENKRVQERKLNIAVKPCVYKKAVIIRFFLLMIKHTV